METTTLQGINWRTDIKQAQTEAQAAKTMVLVELFSPTCWSCQNLEERTFSNETVINTISEQFVPVHYEVLNEPAHLKEFIAGWTPTIIAQCPNGNTHRRWVGFLPPKQFLGELALARVQYALHRQAFDEMHLAAQAAVEVTQGDEVRHSEALYWQAVAAYKASGNSEMLSSGWKDLYARFPKSEWAQRIDFINEM